MRTWGCPVSLFEGIHGYTVFCGWFQGKPKGQLKPVLRVIHTYPRFQTEFLSEMLKGAFPSSPMGPCSIAWSLVNRHEGQVKETERAPECQQWRLYVGTHV